LATVRRAVILRTAALKLRETPTLGIINPSYPIRTEGPGRWSQPISEWVEAAAAYQPPSSWMSLNRLFDEQVGPAADPAEAKTAEEIAGHRNGFPKLYSWALAPAQDQEREAVPFSPAVCQPFLLSCRDLAIGP